MKTRKTAAHKTTKAPSSKAGAGRPEQLPGITMGRVFDVLREAVFVIDAEGRISWCNRAVCALVGAPREGIVGRHCWEIIHAKRGPIERCPFHRARKSLRRESIPFAMGGRIFEVIVDPIRGEGGDCIGAVHTLFDVTEMRKAEERIAYLASFPEETPNPVVECGHDGTVRYMNPAAARIFPAMRAEGARHPFLSGLGALCVEISGAGLHSCMREVACGESRYLQTISFRAGGDDIRIYGTDITERAQAEEDTRENEERFRAIFDQAAIGVAQTSLDGRWLKVNPKLCAIMGYTREEMLATTYQNITHPDDVAASVDQTRRLIAGEFPTYAMEKRYLRKDGSQIWCTVAVSIVRTSAGEPRYTIAVIKDITERKRLQNQLLHFRKMETVGRLAGGIAHDFNNYLTLILNYALFVKQSLPADSPVQEDLSGILKSVESSIALTRQLLAFSRRQVIDTKVVGLNKIVVGIEKMVGRLLGEDIEFMTDLAPDLGFVKADAGTLEQVIVNLVVNARDAMPSGGTLVIQTANAALDARYACDHAEVTPGEYVMLAVRDSGIGISEDVRAHLFEPFFTTKEVGKGTGLGLSSVYGIVAQHKGHIAISSKPGTGTVFKVYLPRVSPAETVKAPASMAAEAPPRGRETILVVEDDPQVRNVTVRMLRNLEYMVLEAASVEDGLRLAEAHGGGIGLVLTDVVMPGMNGKALASRIAEKLPALKVLFMSGYPEDVISRDGIVEAGVGLLSKPFTEAALARKVREALDAPAKGPSVAQS